MAKDQLQAAQARADAVFEGAPRGRIIDDFIVSPGKQVGPRAIRLIEAAEQGRAATKRTLEVETRTDTGTDPQGYRTTMSGDMINGVKVEFQALIPGGTTDSLTHRKVGWLRRQTNVTLVGEGDVQVNSAVLLGTVLRATRVR